MKNRLMLSVAAAALIAGTAMVQAQAPAGGAARSAPAAATPPPSADRAAPAERAAPVNRDEATDTMKQPDSDSAPKAAQSDDKMKHDNGQRAQSGRDSADPAKGGKDMKADGRSPNAADAKDNKGPDNKAADSKGTDARSTTTTGQAGAGAKLSTDQRTKITSVIKEQKIERVTSVNFNISVGTRVPRDVQFHPLPAEIITIYPDWRGYDFILVRDQIIVINPRSFEIVAVIDA
ncbi:DUF1236 domain-containing protein [Tardiphaga sp.]|uniref:DUF1236 domain-containing protein n=1 Tax=Tardiphaga sp. TaxID=1926292 RepID=UPI00260852D2|nr:DUF1236 domain-containing protein [Tardiphaga sp.]MDB5616021.1 hypothetical protein [Tardiphaga sp.]